MSYLYIASPYRAYHGSLEQAAFEASVNLALLLKAGIHAFSPVVHSHAVAVHGNIDPTLHDFWMDHDKPYMAAARGVVLLKLPGWEESRGVGEELEYFRNAGKPVIEMEPGLIPTELLHRRKVVALCGYAGSGKDTAAGAMVACGWQRVAFADAVREALLALDPTIYVPDEGRNVSLSELLNFHDKTWDWLKYRTEVRRFLQRMGTEAGRNIHGNDCWVKIARKKIEASPSDVVITDCRFENEAAMVRSLGGRVIWIERPGVGPVNSHVSDAGLSALKEQADACIVNDGTLEELHAKLIDAAWPQEVTA